MKKLLFILLIVISWKVFSAEDFYQFSNKEEQIRFETLTTQFRCLVCQNQNLAESNAPLANDLRKQIYHKIMNGESDEMIRSYLVERYGNYILYKPPFNFATLGLWVGPFIFLIGGLIYLVFYIRNRSGRK